ncbi:MAG: hypothetical protein QJR03_06640 [Sphaerobacter sp.]|nr:hypothetical protein [Sphaerobacter sp.]
MEFEPRRLNFSFVLHEPASSELVGAFAARSHAEARRIHRAARRLAALPDPALRERIVVLTEAGAAPNLGEPGEAQAPVATVHLGPWWLLPRVLGLVASAARPRPIHLLDQPTAPTARPVTFFRATARLHLPDPAAQEHRPAWFAALVLRPGGDSLLLRLTPLPGSDAALLAAAERAIRAYVEQWTCAEALWDGPAEARLPELAMS